MMMELLFIFLFVSFKVEIGGRRISEDLITDLNTLQDELSGLFDEFGDRQSENGDATHGKATLDDIDEINSHIKEPLYKLDQSDIITEQEDGDKDNEKRNAVGYDQLLWHSRDVPYVFDQSLGANARKVILEAMSNIQDVSCIKFHEKTDKEIYFLQFFDGEGCYSTVGRRRYPTGQPVSIGHGCETKGIVMHEILHSLGFWHEQSRSDRDTYLEVFWENISAGKEHNFMKLKISNSRNLNSPYDYGSIMHYSAYAFSKNGKKTMQSLADLNLSLGQRDKLSPVDINTLYQLYRCGDGKSAGWARWSEWTKCHEDGYRCVKKRYRYCIGGGDDCVGAKYELQQCRMCKQDGHWGLWSTWSICDATNCAKGRKTRTRKCDDPKPFQGGRYCMGRREEFTNCIAACPKRCTFEEDSYCGYTKSGLWKLNKGATPSLLTGPSSDADGDPDGLYLYTEVTGSSDGYLSTLLSPTFSGSKSPRCYSFQYHMYGATIGDLKLYSIDNGIRSLIWEKSGNQGNQWYKVEIDIEKNEPFQMKFESHKGSSHTGDVALDNLFLTDGACDKASQ